MKRLILFGVVGAMIVGLFGNALVARAAPGAQDSENDQAAGPPAGRGEGRFPGRDGQGQPERVSPFNHPMAA